MECLFFIDVSNTRSEVEVEEKRDQYGRNRIFKEQNKKKKKFKKKCGGKESKGYRELIYIFSVSTAKF